MNGNQLTCDEVDREDLDTRYLRGTLREAEAERFEAHYFGCERCWALVQRGAELQSAAAPDATVRAMAGRRPATVGRLRWSRPVWIGLAAAVVIAVVGIGQWQARHATPGTPEPATVRGLRDTLVVVAAMTDRGLAASWGRVDSTSVYRVRLFTPSGEVLVEEETPDTSVFVTWSRVPARQADSLYWQVQALDQLLTPLARSPLTSTASRPSRLR